MEIFLNDSTAAGNYLPMDKAMKRSRHKNALNLFTALSGYALLAVVIGRLYCAYD